MREPPKWYQHGRPVGTALRAVRDVATTVALVPVIAATWLKRKVKPEPEVANPAKSEEALYGCYAKPKPAEGAATPQDDKPGKPEMEPR